MFGEIVFYYLKNKVNELHLAIVISELFPMIIDKIMFLG